MVSLEQVIRGWLHDLGPAWILFGMLLLCASILFGTWTLFAFVAGIFVTLYIHPYDVSQIRRERSSAVLSKSLQTAAEQDLSADNDQHLSASIPTSLRTEMEAFSEQVITNYVRWWYQPPNFPKDELFPRRCQASLNHTLNGLYASFSKKDLILYFDAIFTTYIATLGAVLDDLRSAHKLRSADDKLGLVKFISLHPNAIITRMMNAAERKENLRKTSNDFLTRFVSKSDLECQAAAEFLKQLLSTSIFAASLQTLAHRDTINRTIIEGLKTKPAGMMKSAEPQAQLAAVLDLASKQAATVSVETLATTDEDQVNFESAVAEDNSASTAGTGHTLTEPATKSRGRRLSFKNKSVSSIADFYDEDGNRLPDRRLSFLKRTSSLLSKSRSRSSSPVKCNEQDAGQKHSRSRSTSPLKKVAANEMTVSVNSHLPTSDIRAESASLYRAEIIVNDASDIKAAEYNNTINTQPKFFLLISPTKQEGSINTGGIGIFRSMAQIELLHEQFKLLSLSTLPALPDWKGTTYAKFEENLLSYLLNITRDKYLVETEVFRQFCRPDVMPDDNESDQKKVQVSSTSTDDSLQGSSSAFSGMISRPASPARRSDPSKMTHNALHLSNEMLASRQEMHALLAAKHEQFPTSQTVDRSELAKTGVETKPMEPRIVMDRIDVQNLVSQCMELLTTFYSLSSRTWTIRKQLLNVLRNLLLSKNSIYTQALLVFLDENLLKPFSSTEHVARHWHKFNAFMFPEHYTTPAPLTYSESAALATEARALFISKGIPSAIRNLMGGPSTAEALEILFDAIQDPDFSLGLVSLLFTETAKTLLAE